MNEDFIDETLRKLRLERTRENYLYVLFGGEPLPEDWGALDEVRNLPEDLRSDIYREP